MNKPTVAVVIRDAVSVHPTSRTTDIVNNYRTAIEERRNAMNDIWQQIRHYAASHGLLCEIRVTPRPPKNPQHLGYNIHRHPHHHRALLSIEVRPPEEIDGDIDVESEYKSPDNQADNIFCTIASNGQHGLLLDVLYGALATVQILEGRSNFTRFLAINLY